MPKKLTVVKVISRDDFRPTKNDIERWRRIIADKSVSEQEAVATGEVDIQHVTIPDEEGYLTLVRVGDDNYKPTIADLEIWRDIFASLKDDAEPTVFATVGVEIDVIKIGDIVAVE